MLQAQLCELEVAGAGTIGLEGARGSAPDGLAPLDTLATQAITRSGPLAAVKPVSLDWSIIESRSVLPAFESAVVELVPPGGSGRERDERVVEAQ